MADSGKIQVSVGPDDARRLEAMLNRIEDDPGIELISVVPLGDRTHIITRQQEPAAVDQQQAAEALLRRHNQARIAADQTRLQAERALAQRDDALIARLPQADQQALRARAEDELGPKLRGRQIFVENKMRELVRRPEAG